MSKTSSSQLERSDLRKLIDLAKAESKREINCHAVGTIIAFDAATATANITLNYKKILKQRNAINLKEYTDVVVDYPVLVRCPVTIMNGGGAYTTYPIAAGDSCLVLFCDRDIDAWFEFGSTQSPPNSERMHDLSDGVAIVGVYALNRAVSNYSTTSVKTVFGRVIAEFTNLIASIKDRHGERLVPVGTGPVPTFLTVPPSGWLFMYGQTLGNASSNATEQSDDYEDLFNILASVAPNSGGNFSSGDQIIIPDLRGRNWICNNSLGGSDAGVLTGTYTPNRNTLGGKVGEEAHQLSIAEMPSHTHGVPTVNTDTSNGGLNPWSSQVSIQTNLPTTSAGGDVPHNNVPPGMIVNAMIKY